MGDVTLDGKSIWSPEVDLLTLRRRVGMLFQRPNPFPMSIRDNVVAGVKAHRIAKGKQLDVVAEQRLTEVGLWDAVKDRLGDSPFRLSGGQQQLLCLARALAVGPEVLLFDEPTSSLDPITTEYIEALMKTLAPALSLIVVTHNLGQADADLRPDHVLLSGAWSNTARRTICSLIPRIPTPSATSPVGWASRDDRRREPRRSPPFADRQTPPTATAPPTQGEIAVRTPNARRE